MGLADGLVARIERASLADIAAARFLVDDGGDAGPRDARRVANALMAVLASKNQFAASEPKLEQLVRAEIERLFAALGFGENRAAAFAACASHLKNWFEDALGHEPREVTSAAYSPELQLAILGLGLEAMREPILDVGCGPDARLVRFLREHGKSVQGIDVRAPSDATRASWLVFDYGVARFGTIVSHLGFTLHFMHQEMKASDLAYEYARAYMRIVRALAPGGTFAYVPAVPFIEAMLPKEKLLVTRVPLAADLVTDSVRRVQEATNLVLDAATHVTARS